MTYAEILTSERELGCRRADRDLEFHGFYVTFYPRVARYCYRLVRDEELARDLAQEAFARVLARWVTVRDPEPYIFLVATNLVRTAMRRSTLEGNAMALHGAAAALAAEPPTVDHPAVRYEVGRLPTRYRELVLLHYFADLPLAVIAAAVRRPQGTVKRQLAEARALLAVALEAC